MLLLLTITGDWLNQSQRESEKEPICNYTILQCTYDVFMHVCVLCV